MIGFSVRCSRSAGLLAVAMLTVPCALAAAPAEAPAAPDVAAVADLESRAASAKVADQCILLAELARSLTDLAGHQLAAGHTDEATATVHRLNATADRIHASLNAAPKHLQEAELALHASERRLADIARVTSDNSAEDLHTTLQHLNQVHTELLTQLFRH